MILARWELRARLALRGLLVRKEQPGLRGPKETQELRARLVQPAQWDLKVLKGRRATPEQLER